MTQRLVLVGGGLAHLHVLGEWRRDPIPEVELVVVSPEPRPWYSGMVPGYLRGEYEAPALEIDLAHLTHCAGGRLVVAAADRVLRAERVVECEGERLAFDACSIDAGSAPSGSTVPGMREHASSLRPMSNARRIRVHLDALAALGTARVVIVGAGAGGVEVAFAVHRRLAGTAPPATVVLVDGGGTVLPDETDALRRQLHGRLRQRGIGVVLGSAVSDVREDAVRLASGAVIPADLVIWTAGGAPPALLAASDLPRNDAGYLLVDPRLLAIGGTGVWGAGDCIALDGRPPVPRSGAYALRQGETLLHNLRAALASGRPRAYRPRHRALAILDTGDGAAVARWGRVHGSGAWAWRLKRRIDVGFVNDFRRPCDEKGSSVS